jgi:hypothetical protein
VFFLAWSGSDLALALFFECGYGSFFLAQSGFGWVVAVFFWLGVAPAWLWQCFSDSAWPWLGCGKVGGSVFLAWSGSGVALAVFFSRSEWNPAPLGKLFV